MIELASSADVYLGLYASWGRSLPRELREYADDVAEWDRKK